MDLDRGVLARTDRKLLADLGHDETFWMVRVPVTAVKWSTWKRYCDSAGISMVCAIAALIDHELSGVVGDSSGDGSPVLPGAGRGGAGHVTDTSRSPGGEGGGCRGMAP